MRGPGEGLSPSLSAVRDRPASAGVFLDYDGTLAPIVERPEDARPAAGAPEVVARLARRLKRVAVVSGRPTSFLASQLGRPPGLEILGLYGMERLGGDGAPELEPATGAWLGVVEEVRRRADASAPPGARVEGKRISVTLHWRGRPEVEPWARRFVDETVAATGLEVQPGRMALELRPPIELDKGTVVRELGSGLEAVAYFGDDLGDLAAFEALDVLEAGGARATRVAVADADSAGEVLDRADVVVEGPEAAVSLLRVLAAGSGEG